MNIFGMVTTCHSHAYTAQALRSFFEATSLAPGDRFFLIDNDGIVDPRAYPTDRQVTLVVNSTPIGFAANVNQVLRLARDQRGDLFFLNNDVIFTPNWLAPLLGNEPALRSPLSNFQRPYRAADFNCRPMLNLADYVGHEEALRQIVVKHQTVEGGCHDALKVPFFCIKIPYAVYATVGELDERFGKGGGEDCDYCLRCHQAGFGVQFALGSYVLHFMGKSTWRGAETAPERRQRERAYLGAFRDKWGSRLLDLMCFGRLEAGSETAALKEALKQGRFREVIERLREPEVGPVERLVLAGTSS
jgi:GT2 family glycosyltransferase